MRISFREFLELDKETQRQLGNMNMNEELTRQVKNKKMDELQKLLSQHDWWWFDYYSLQWIDGPATRLSRK